jgi:hypothetical protein
MVRVSIEVDIDNILSSDDLLTIDASGSHTKFVGKASAHAENVGESNFPLTLVWSKVRILIPSSVIVFDDTGSKVIKGKAVSDWAED